MRVSMHLILLTIVAVLGVGVLILGAALSYSDLEKGQQDQRVAYEAMSDLEKTKSDFNRLLTTGDLIFGVSSDVNTYLIPPMITQIKQLERRCQKLGKRRVLGQLEMVSLIDYLITLKHHFSLLLKTPDPEGYQAYETVSHLMIREFQQIFKRSKTQARLGVQSLQSRKDSLFNTILLLSALYALLMILLIIWGAKSISHPISTLHRSAKLSLERNEPFILQQIKGPSEILSLAQIMYRLINQLEREVSKKTKDLESENLARRDTEKTLLELNARQAPLVEAWNQMSEAVEILTPQGLVLFVNPAYLSLFKLDCADGVLHHPSSLYQESSILVEGALIGDQILQHAIHGLSWSEEIEVHIHTQKRIHALHSSPVFQDSDELSQIIVIRRDITEERIAQASAAHNDRLAAIGTLAAGMAHEINNPLTYIKMSLDLIKEELEGPQDAKEISRGVSQGSTVLNSEIRSEILDALCDATDGVDRVSHIVQSLLNVARSGGVKGSSEQISSMSLLRVFQSCANLMKADLTHKTKLTLNIREDLMIWGRRSELTQVFLNFLINAVQAMPEGREDNLIQASAETESGMTKIVIQDNAKGIPHEDLDHIFDPFFSSKPVGEGTGLGLSVSKGIIEAHQGSIKASSIVGIGTTFTIRLPVIETALPKMIAQDIKNQAHQAASGAVTQGDQQGEVRALIDRDFQSYSKYKILIVDDDLLVSKSLKKMLSRYDTQVENSSVSAFDRLKTERFDLILSDVMMPEFTGIELYWKVIQSHERYLDRFIFITGAAKSHHVNEELSRTGRLILRKPITRPNLLMAIQDSLDEMVQGDHA